MNTKFSYIYRDAENYKASNTIVLEGELTEAQINEMLALLDCNGCFVPSDVGLPHLHEELQRWDTQDYDIDHPFHELHRDYICSTKEEPNVPMSARKLYEKFKEVDGHWSIDMQVGWDNTSARSS